MGRVEKKSREIERRRMEGGREREREKEKRKKKEIKTRREEDCSGKMIASSNGRQNRERERAKTNQMK